MNHNQESGMDTADYDFHDDLPTDELLAEAERIAANQYKDGRYAAARVLRILCHRLAAATKPSDADGAELNAWHEMVTMAHVNRDGLWPNNWPQNVAWIAHCLHTGSPPPTMTEDAEADARATRGLLTDATCALESMVEAAERRTEYWRDKARALSGVVDDAMVNRALDAYHAGQGACIDAHELRAMRRAITAALAPGAGR